MITANALDGAANEAAEHLTATEDGRRIARNLADALADYTRRAGLAGQNPRETAETIAATIANALEAAICTPADEHAELERRLEAERQAAAKLDQARKAYEAAHAERLKAADAYDAATERNHHAAQE